METLKKLWKSFMYADQDYEPWDLVFVSILAFTITFTGSDPWATGLIFLILFPITYRSVAARLARRKAEKLSEAQPSKS